MNTSSDFNLTNAGTVSAAVATPPVVATNPPRNLPSVTAPDSPVSQEEEAWPRPSEEDDKHARLKRKSQTAPQSWLDRDPTEWIGKKLRNKKTGAFFFVRVVYRNGRVELEKNWMAYSFTVQAIRADFEVYS